jgi:hypothetical protein
MAIPWESRRSASAGCGTSNDWLALAVGCAGRRLGATGQPVCGKMEDETRAAPFAAFSIHRRETTPCFDLETNVPRGRGRCSARKRAACGCCC